MKACALGQVEVADAASGFFRPDTLSRRPCRPTPVFMLKLGAHEQVCSHQLERTLLSMFRLISLFKPGEKDSWKSRGMWLRTGI